MQKREAGRRVQVTLRYIAVRIALLLCRPFFLEASPEAPSVY